MTSVPKATLCKCGRLLLHLISSCSRLQPSFPALTSSRSLSSDSFPAGSVWSAVPLLTALEKGFTDNELEKRTVNLRRSLLALSQLDDACSPAGPVRSTVEGQNFAPAFLKSEFCSLMLFV